MGRPPIQHHKIVHTIALSPETEEFLDKALDRYAVVSPVRALLGNPEFAKYILGFLGVAAAYWAVRQATTPAEDAAKGFVCTLGAAAGLSQEDCDRVWADAKRTVKDIPIVGGIFEAFGL